MEKKKTFKEQLAYYDSIIANNEYDSGCNVLVHYAREQRTSLIEKQLTKRKKQVKKLEKMLGTKELEYDTNTNSQTLTELEHLKWRIVNLDSIEDIKKAIKDFE